LITSAEQSWREISGGSINEIGMQEQTNAHFMAGAASAHEARWFSCRAPRFALRDGLRRKEGILRSIFYGHKWPFFLSLQSPLFAKLTPD